MDIIDVLTEKGKLENDLALNIVKLAGEFTGKTGVRIKNIDCRFCDNREITGNGPERYFGGVKVFLDI